MVAMTSFREKPLSDSNPPRVTSLARCMRHTAATVPDPYSTFVDYLF